MEKTSEKSTSIDHSISTIEGKIIILKFTFNMDQKKFVNVK